MLSIITQYNSEQLLVFGVNTILFLLAALGAVFGTLPKLSRDILTLCNTDGKITMLIGAITAIIGMIVTDYAGAYALTAIGITLLAYGSFVAMNDKMTDRLLDNRIMFAIYLFTASFTYFYGATYLNWFSFNPFLILWLTLAAGIGSAFATLIALSFSTQEFCQRVLPADDLGKMLMKRSLAILIMSPLASANPALMTVIAALGAFLLTLGMLIAAPEHVTQKWLSVRRVPWYAVGMTALFFIARFGIAGMII